MPPSTAVVLYILLVHSCSLLVTVFLPLAAGARPALVV